MAELSRAQAERGWAELGRSGPSQAKQSAFVATATDNKDIGQLLNCMTNMLPKWMQNLSPVSQNGNHPPGTITQFFRHRNRFLLQVPIKETDMAQRHIYTCTGEALPKD